MTETTVTGADVEDRTNKGLQNLWYPVLPSWRLKGDPLGITRLSQNIVLWRDPEGEVHAIDDRCPHRGARLSLGWNLGDRLGCWYHGVEVTADGKVANVPAASDCKLIGRTTAHAYPVKEVAGAIFLYFGDEAHLSAPPLDPPEELVNSDKYSHFLCTAYWDCNYRYAIDNVTYPMMVKEPPGPAFFR